MVLRTTQPHIVEAVVKSLKWLLSSVLADACTRCGTDLSRDYLEIVSRVEHEGLSFLTITLPNFCSDFERCLDRGQVTSNDFLGFKRSSSLPLFLGGLTSLVFDGRGSLLGEPSVDAILCIRQICLMFKKVRLACAPKRIRKAIDRFKECENEVSALPDYETDDQYGLYRTFRQVSGILYTELGARYNRKVETLTIVPKHGPGATAERVSGNSKYTIKSWHVRLQEHFPLDQFALPNAGWFDEETLKEIDFIEPVQEPPVRVILVPKTLKTPRVIAIEPVCMQYTQQAMMEFMVNELESMKYTSGHVNFRDQTVNQRLAASSSKWGTFATLDLKEASDRVSLSLVKAMLGHSPDFLRAILSCRSYRATLPDGEILHLSKFASMGSALCFPIEAMAFYAICITGIIRRLREPVTPNNVRKAANLVYVYGDDIIVPTDQVQPVLETLEAFGLQTNAAKSFWTGKFRESCGFDAYDGVRVTPVYLRELFDGDRRSKRGLVSLVSFANQLYESGWWQTARDVRAYVESLVGPLPHVLNTSPGLGWTSFLGSYSVEKWDQRQHAFLVKSYALKPIEYDDPIHGRGALLKFFLSRGKSDRKSEFHKTGRRGDVHINRRWVRPF